MPVEFTQMPQIERPSKLGELPFASYIVNYVCYRPSPTLRAGDESKTLNRLNPQALNEP